LQSVTVPGSIVVKANNGGLNYTSLNAKKSVSITTTRDALNTAATDIRGGAITAAASDPANAVNVTAQAGTVVLGALTATTGGVSLESQGGALSTGLIKAVSQITASSQGQLSTGTLTSSGAGVNLSAHNGGIGFSSISAFGAADLTATRDENSLAVTDIRGGAITARAVDPNSAINVTAQAGTVVLGALTATTGGVSLESQGGALSTGLISGTWDIRALAKGNLLTGNITSLNAGINISSETGSISATSANAKTSFVAESGTSLKINTFAVSAGGATLKASADLHLPKGTAYGLIDASAGGNAWLGELISTTNRIHATSVGGGLSFSTLKAATGIRLRASKALGAGTNAAFALIGTTVDAGSGGVDALATSGHLQFGKMIARANSLLTTKAGDLRVSSISFLSKNQLTATAEGGSLVLPAGY
jgi:hypothetical protein